MGLKTVAYIKEHGLDKLLEEFKLKANIYDNKVIIKYDQIECNMSLEIVQECRGLILEKDTWKVMSYPLKKFFNYQEGNAPKIDWDKSFVLEKVDGTFIQLYYDWNKEEWLCGTSGTAEAEGGVNMREDFTFKELFWETIKNYPGFSTERLFTNCVFMFELTTPYNTVVKQHKKSELTLLAIRNRETLMELDYQTCNFITMALKVPMVKRFDMSPTDISELTDTFRDMPYSEEGYIVMDNDMNRVKVKNPAYVAVHHLKDKFNAYNIMEIIKTNEVDEFNATFPERTEEVLGLKKKFDELTSLLIETWAPLSIEAPINTDDKLEQKLFAEKVFDVTGRNDKLKNFSGLFFGLSNGNVEYIGDYLRNYNNKRLYLELKHERWNTNE